VLTMRIMFSTLTKGTKASFDGAGGSLVMGLNFLSVGRVNAGRHAAH